MPIHTQSPKSTKKAKSITTEY